MQRGVATVRGYGGWLRAGLCQKSRSPRQAVARACKANPDHPRIECDGKHAEILWGGRLRRYYKEVRVMTLKCKITMGNKLLYEYEV